MVTKSVRSRVCGSHFQSGRPSRIPEHCDYVPNLNLGYRTDALRDQSLSLSRFNRARERRKQSTLLAEQAQVKERERADVLAAVDRNARFEHDYHVAGVCAPENAIDHEQRMEGREQLGRAYTEPVVMLMQL